MHEFRYQHGSLHCEEVPIRELAERHGTPLYVYSSRVLRDHVARLREAFDDVPHLICYSVKSNSNLALLELMRREGTGFDVVSGGELARALRAGADPRTVVFAGVGKTAPEMDRALRAGILYFNVESEGELRLLAERAQAAETRAPVALRLNPDVDPHTHRHITTGKHENKFGLTVAQARAAIELTRSLDGLELRALHMHIGSQILEVEPYARALERMLEFADELRGRGTPIEAVNVGGGFGAWYRGGEARSAAEFAEAIVPPVRERGLRLLLEPGRFICGNAGILVARVLFVKRSEGRRFVILDAGMNDLIRPALYEAFHRILPVEGIDDPARLPAEGDAQIVGPVCETGDTFGRDRWLPEVKSGDLIALFGAGAYGFSMASTYNSRPRPAEVLVAGARSQVAREREREEDLWAHERPLEV
jgi:diaminopimelate decarboxylase